MLPPELALKRAKICVSIFVSLSDRFIQSIIDTSSEYDDYIKSLLMTAFNVCKYLCNKSIEQSNFDEFFKFYHSGIQLTGPIHSILLLDTHKNEWDEILKSTTARELYYTLSPYTSYISGNICSTCGSTNNLKLCNKCNYEAYCSKECKCEDWNKRHKYICNSNKTLRQQYNSKIPVLPLRLTCKEVFEWQQHELNKLQDN